MLKVLVVFQVFCVWLLGFSMGYLCKGRKDLADGTFTPVLVVNVFATMLNFVIIISNLF